MINDKKKQSYIININTTHNTHTHIHIYYYILYFMHILIYIID